MPLYEYKCNACRKRITKLIRSLEKPVSASCDYCGSEDLARLISKFTVHNSWGSSLNWAPSSEAFNSADPDNPREMANYMRRMQQEMGGEVTSEFTDVVHELDSEASTDAT